MVFEVDSKQVDKCFDRIASQLLKRKALFINNSEFRFTEIEFYYFHEDDHQDKYTHKHDRRSGEWRFHKQGIDITFNSDNKCDGGILIRGILTGSEYVNGPIKTLSKIFEAFGKAQEPSSMVLKDGETRDVLIIKTFRHLPNKIIYENFYDKHYRYLTDLKELKIPDPIKKQIEANHSVLLDS